MLLKAVIATDHLLLIVNRRVVGAHTVTRVPSQARVTRGWCTVILFYKEFFFAHPGAMAYGKLHIASSESTTTVQHTHLIAKFSTTII
jgi:hypothetical protein